MQLVSPSSPVLWGVLGWGRRVRSNFCFAAMWGCKGGRAELVAWSSCDLGLCAAANQSWDMSWHAASSLLRGFSEERRSLRTVFHENFYFFGEIGSCASNSELVWLAVVNTLGMSS